MFRTFWPARCIFLLSLTSIFIENIVVSYKHVVIIHGILDKAVSMSDLKEMIEQAHSGTNVTIIDMYDQEASIFTPMWHQLAGVKKVLQQIMSESKNGIHLIGFSQGGLLARSIIENCSDHNIDTFISMSSPQMGQFGVTSYFSKYLPTATRDLLYLFLYKCEFQDHLTIANYWKDPYHQSHYLKGNIYLPFVNNNNASIFADEKKFEEQKRNFLKIKTLVLIGGPDDGVITPWQSAQFGFYDKNLDIISMTEQQVYIEDWFGLKTLDERGSIHSYTFSNIKHIHWHGNREVFEKAVKPWLT